MVTYPIIVIALIVLYLMNSIKILREYERGVIFRLGRVLEKPFDICLPANRQDGQDPPQDRHHGYPVSGRHHQR